jgi:hypothetical protein
MPSNSTGEIGSGLVHAGNLLGGEAFALQEANERAFILRALAPRGATGALADGAEFRYLIHANPLPGRSRKSRDSRALFLFVKRRLILARGVPGSRAAARLP